MMMMMITLILRWIIDTSPAPSVCSVKR